MRKRLLLCLWGHRTHDLHKIINNYNSKFSTFDIDLLISTWNSVDIDAYKFKYVVKHEVPTDEYLDQIGFPYTEQLKATNQRHHPARTGHYALFFHSYQIAQYIRNNNLQYDALIKARTDLYFTTDYEFNFETNIVYLLENLMSQNYGVNDQFLAGKFEYVLNAFATETFQEAMQFISGAFNPEEGLHKLFIQKNVQYNEITTTHYTLLPDRRIK